MAITSRFPDTFISQCAEYLRLIPSSDYSSTKAPFLDVRYVAMRAEKRETMLVYWREPAQISLTPVQLARP